MPRKDASHHWCGTACSPHLLTILCLFDSTNIAANTFTAEDLASTKLNPPLLLLTLASKINIWHRTRKVFVVNVNNLLDVPVAEVLGLESRGQTGCSWARRPPRQHLTRLIEEHTIKDCFFPLGWLFGNHIQQSPSMSKKVRFDCVFKPVC